jgi:hypothetical protein
MVCVSPGNIIIILEIPGFSVGPTAMLSILNPRLEKTVEMRVKTPDSLKTVMDLLLQS